jgi:hypothetical protein
MQMDAWAILMIAGCLVVLILAAVAVCNRRSSVPQLAQEDDSDEAGDQGGMPSILPPYSYPTSICPKCRRAVKTADYCSGGGCFLRIHGEHLHRRCACGYEWAEATADADQMHPCLTKRISFDEFKEMYPPRQESGIRGEGADRA